MERGEVTGNCGDNWASLKGTAADLIKVAMICIYDELRAANMESKMILQVHDELVFEAPPAEVESLRAMVKRLMEGVRELNVPLVVEVGEGEGAAGDRGAEDRGRQRSTGIDGHRHEPPGAQPDHQFAHAVAGDVGPRGVGRQPQIESNKQALEPGMIS